jgi:gluconate 2-dehydrogenase gamma chain
MKSTNSARRDFLLQMGGVAGVAWLNAQWPAIAAAAQHAHEAARTNPPTAFAVLTPAEAREVQAIAARIIPTDELPGATEAGVVHFIDRALKTFAKDTRPAYTQGILSFNQATARMFPGVARFSAATPEQQDAVLASMTGEAPKPTRGRLRPATGAPVFFEIIWFHTVAGFLADPEAGGNRDYAGWKVIGRDPAHSFSPPFGAYDKDYPGWQAAPKDTEKP